MGASFERVLGEILERLGANAAAIATISPGRVSIVDLGCDRLGLQLTRPALH